MGMGGVILMSEAPLVWEPTTMETGVWEPTESEAGPTEPMLQEKYTELEVGPTEVMVPEEATFPEAGPSCKPRQARLGA